MDSRNPASQTGRRPRRKRRKNILNKFRAKPGHDDPAVMQRQAEREAQAADRAKAKLARDAAKAEKKIRDAEAAAQAAAQLARERKKLPPGK